MYFYIQYSLKFQVDACGPDQQFKTFFCGKRLAYWRCLYESLCLSSWVCHPIFVSTGLCTSTTKRGRHYAESTCTVLLYPIDFLPTFPRTKDFVLQATTAFRQVYWMLAGVSKVSVLWQLKGWFGIFINIRLYFSLYQIDIGQTFIGENAKLWHLFFGVF